MENFVKILCRLCHSSIVDKHFTVIEDPIRELLDILHLKPIIEETNKSAICNVCRTKLFEAFHFKAICMDTEDSLFPYVQAKNGEQVDLRDVYLKEGGKEHLKGILEGEKVCRLCMQMAICGFTPAKDVKNDLTQNYIPEVNFKSTTDPVICSLCLDSLKTHWNFLSGCLNELEIKNKCYDNTGREQLCIKKEEIDLKLEEDDEVNYTDQQTDEPTNSDDVGTSSPKTERLKYELSEAQMYEHDSKHEKVSKVATQKIKYKLVNVHKCDTCSFETIKKKYLAQHQLKHKNVSEVQTYNCESCSFKTIYKSSLLCHQLKHEDVLKLQMYKCDKCLYKTKYKNYLTVHGITHKDKSETQMYKCGKCNFETKYKGSWHIHEKLQHENVSNLQMYKCDKCLYETKYKQHVASHEITHKDSSNTQMYKCDKCNFETKHRRSLAAHDVRHKNNSVMHTSREICNHPTRNKRYILKKVHDETQMYKCHTCNYETCRKYDMRKHQLKHRAKSMAQMYKCDACNFESKYKGNLITHKARHKEAQMYKCDRCHFGTNYKRTLVRHEAKHRDSTSSRDALNSDARNDT